MNTALEIQKLGRSLGQVLSMDPVKGSAKEHILGTLNVLKELYAAGELESMVHLLPFLFTLKGKPLTLRRHFMMEFAYRLKLPRKQTWKCARQVSKSVNLAVSGLCACGIQPHLYMLTIAPRYEQVRRFSSMYVRPILKESPIRHLITDTTVSDSVLQRTFSNGSMQFYSFAYLDCERIRGIASEWNRFDESVCAITAICKLTDAGTLNTMICRIEPGDLVLGFDDDGNIVPDRVISVIRKKPYPVWKVTLQDGKSIRCTAHTKLRTTAGWVYLQELVDAASARRFGIKIDPTRRPYHPDASRDAVRRWKHGLDRQEAWALSRTARLQASGVLRAQGRTIEELREDVPADHDQLRIREIQLRFQHGDLPRVRVYTRPDVQAREEDGDAGAVPDAGLGGDSLLVHGRRVAVEQGAVLLHPRLHAGGSPAAGGPPDGAGSSGARHAGTEEGEDVSHGQDQPAGRPDVRGAGQAIHAPLDAVQAGGDDAGDGDLHVLRGDVCRRQEAEGRTHPVLPEPGMPEEAAARLRREVVPQGCGPQQGEEQGAVPGERGDQAGAGPATGRESPRGPRPPARTERVQGGLARGTPEGQAAGAGGLHVLRETGSAREQEQDGPRGLVREGALPAGEAQDKLRPLESATELGHLVPVDIESIELDGEEEVWDLETEKHHAFLADGIAIHNCQDIDPSFIPIINETLSASENLGIQQYSGTPKTFENPLEVLFDEGSQAEWCTKCSHCGHWNVASIHEDLIKMIQPAGVCCSKCGKVINPATGHFEHRFPLRRARHESYHVPQVIMPFHYDNPGNWAELVEAKEKMPIHMFYNEKLGESYDMASSLLTRSDLKAASTLPWPNLRDKAPAAPALQKYIARIAGVDWGGGGLSEISYTTFAALGVRPGGKMDVLFMDRLSRTLDPAEEVKLILYYMSRFKCGFLAHDYGSGAGQLRETMMIQAGLPLKQIFNVNYVRASRADLVVYHPPEEGSSRWYYSLDKARSLLIMSQLIKQRWFSFPSPYESWEQYGNDLLALIEDKHKAPSGTDVYLVTSKASSPDDMSHSINFAACSYWHHANAYPDLIKKIGVRISADDMKKMNPAHPRY